MNTKQFQLGVLILVAALIAGCGGGGSGSSGPVTLTSVEITPNNPTARYAQQQRLSATGHYSDGSTKQLVNGVAWSSSDTSIASIGLTGPNTGLVTGNMIGSVTVSATSGGVTDNATFKVIGAVSLPRTGQVTCYDPAGATVINCTSSGQDGEKLVGQSWPQSRYLVGTGATADCVTDTLTGLMWTKDGNLPFTLNPGPANGKRIWNTALNFPKNVLNSQSYCGFSDWRLPNVVELESLVDSEVANQAVNLNALGFINVQGVGPTDASGYWTSTSNSVIPGKAWGVDMRSGCTGTCHLNTDQANYVWPVRGPDATVASIVLPRTGQTVCYDELGNALASCAGTGQDGEFQSGAVWPVTRFTLPIGSCITDNLTGLTWAKNPMASGKQTMVDALIYVKSALCSQSDWRLPNRKELFSIMFNGGTGSQLSADWLATKGFSIAASGCYWTSTNVDNGAGAGWEAVWYVHPDDGQIEPRNKLTTPDCYAWPVRGGL